MQVVRGRGVITELHWPAWEELAFLIEPEEYAPTEDSRVICNFNWIIFFYHPPSFSFLRIQRRSVLTAVL